MDKAKGAGRDVCICVRFLMEGGEVGWRGKAESRVLNTAGRRVQ